MIVGRRQHACASFKDGDKKSILVTGGGDGTVLLDSTEIFSDNVWRTVAGTLPQPMYRARAASIDNRVLLFGKNVIPH